MQRNPRKVHKKCPRCGKEFFTILKVEKFPEMQTAVIGQAPVPEWEGGTFYLLKCIFCEEIVEPDVIRGPRDPLNEPYDELLDSLDDARKQKEEEASVVKAEEL